MSPAVEVGPCVLSSMAVESTRIDQDGRCVDHGAMNDPANDSTADFNERYRVVKEPPMRRAELRVIGSDYGATSYTTKDQADQLARVVGLVPGMLLLDVGTGAGWPGIYLGHSTGCRVVATDLPLEGLKTAKLRMHEDGVDGAVVATAGDSLPFGPGSFDAATSSDVFC